MKTYASFRKLYTLETLQLLFLVLALSLIGCTKAEIEEVDNCKIIKTTIADTGPYPATITYTFTDNKIATKEIIFNQGTFTSKDFYKYSYTGNNLTKIEFFINGQALIEQLISYNTDGTIKEIKDYAMGEYTGIRNFTYSAGKLTKFASRAQNNSSYNEYDASFEYAGGNIKSAVWTNLMDPSNVFKYEYTYSTAPNTHFKNRYFFDHVTNSSERVLPIALSENLISSYKISTGNGSPVSQTDYTFIFLADGKIESTKAVTTGFSKRTTEGKYEYQCQ